MSWARRHSWGEYLVDRDGDDAPYTRLSPDEDLGKGHELVVLPDGVSAHGVVFSSERLIMGNLIPAIEAGGDRGVDGKSDGTYKIGYEGGWELFALGTHTGARDPAANALTTDY